MVNSKNEKDYQSAAQEVASLLEQYLRRETQARRALDVEYLSAKSLYDFVSSPELLKEAISHGFNPDDLTRFKEGKLTYWIEEGFGLYFDKDTITFKRKKFKSGTSFKIFPDSPQSNKEREEPYCPGRLLTVDDETSEYIDLTA